MPGRMRVARGQLMVVPALARITWGWSGGMVTGNVTLTLQLSGEYSRLTTAGTVDGTPGPITCAGSVSNGSNGLASNSLRDSKWQVWLSRAICPRTGKVRPKTARRTHPMLRGRILRSCR